MHLANTKFGGGNKHGRTESFPLLGKAPWIAATTLLCLLATPSPVSAFSPLTKTAPLAGGIRSLNPSVQLHSPSRLRVAAEPAVEDVEDMESLRGSDGIYSLVDGDQHK